MQSKKKFLNRFKSFGVMLFVLFLSATFMVHADNDNATENNNEEATLDRMAYSQGDIRVGDGTSFLRLGYGAYNVALSLTTNTQRRGMLLPVFARVSYGFNEWLSLGGQLGYYSTGRESVSAPNEFFWERRFTYVGGRGEVHFAEFMYHILEDEQDIDESLDLYSGIDITMVYRSYNSWTTVEGTSTSLRPSYGVFVGGRYYFNESFAVYSEAGRGLAGLVSLGVELRL